MARVLLLDEDPDLASGLDPSERRAAAPEATADLIEVETGHWQAPQSHHGGDLLVGLLMIRGLMARNVEIEVVRFTELIGQADLLRPWQPPAPESAVASHMRWEVLEEARIAAIDRQLIARLAPWPAVIDALIGRAMQRTRSLAFHLGVCYLPRVELRLLLVLWHFANRWGQGGTDGMLVPLDLDHALLARIVGARKPTVTTAIAGLQRAGVVERLPGGWLLRGDPPKQLQELRRQTEA